MGCVFPPGIGEKYPEPQYVTVVSIKLSAKRSQSVAIVAPIGGTPTQTYKMNLVVEGKQRFISLTRGSREKTKEK